MCSYLVFTVDLTFDLYNEGVLPNLHNTLGIPVVVIKDGIDIYLNKDILLLEYNRDIDIPINKSNNLHIKNITKDVDKLGKVLYDDSYVSKRYLSNSELDYYMTESKYMWQGKLDKAKFPTYDGLIALLLKLTAKGKILWFTGTISDIKKFLK